MVLVATAILLMTIVGLTVFHFLTHYGKSGSLINKFPGPKSWPIIGNSLDLVVSGGMNYQLSLNFPLEKHVYL